METTKLKIVAVSPENVKEHTLFCVKDITNPGFDHKRKWFEKAYQEGLRIKILKDQKDKMIGFIEYVPGESAWRPVNAQNFMFIHCMYVYAKQDRNRGYGSMLVEECEKEAKVLGMSGVCVMTSSGAWIANKTIFEKNGYIQIDENGRFELLSHKWEETASDPQLVDWKSKQHNYQGWHLLYANQCPWHEKSVQALLNVAMDFGIDLKVRQLNTAKEAQNAPSGFGVFSLLHNGKLLDDHYLSATRFKNIVRKELAISK